MAWSYSWAAGPPVRTGDFFEANAGAPSELTLNVETRRPPSGGSTQVVSGSLTNFAIVFANSGVDLLRVGMNSLTFRSGTAEGMTLEPSSVPWSSPDRSQSCLGSPR